MEFIYYIFFFPLNIKTTFVFDMNQLILLYLAQKKLNINDPIKVVLESDGTEIDEDDYFETLEKNTLIMILKSDEKWCSYSDIRCI